MNLLIGGILAGMVLEAIVLLAWHRRSGRGIGAPALLPNLAAGAMLLLAMLLTLSGAGWFWVLACLGGALVGHVLDLRQRWVN